MAPDPEPEIRTKPFTKGHCAFLAWRLSGLLDSMTDLSNAGLVPDEPRIMLTLEHVGALDKECEVSLGKAEDALNSALASRRSFDEESLRVHLSKARAEALKALEATP